MLNFSWKSCIKHHYYLTATYTSFKIMSKGDKFKKKRDLIFLLKAAVNYPAINPWTINFPCNSKQSLIFINCFPSLSDPIIHHKTHKSIDKIAGCQQTAWKWKNRTKAPKYHISSLKTHLITIYMKEWPDRIVISSIFCFTHFPSDFTEIRPIFSDFSVISFSNWLWGSKIIFPGVSTKFPIIDKSSYQELLWLNTQSMCGVWYEAANTNCVRRKRDEGCRLIIR